MEPGKKDIICRYVRNLNEDDLIVLLNKTYEEGYVDGYNGNDEEKEFNELLNEIYKNAIK